jgi:hypothetical protein
MTIRADNCIRLLTSADARLVNELRLSEYASSQDFKMTDANWAERRLLWSTEDDHAPVLGVWQGHALVATMRADSIADLPGATREFHGAPVPDNHIEWPALTLTRAATRSDFKRSGLNSLMRMHFIFAALCRGIHRLYGYVVVGGERTRLMQRLGYEFLPRPDPDVHHPSDRAWAVAWLDLPKRGESALKALRESLELEVKSYPWKGAKLHMPS